MIFLVNDFLEVLTEKSLKLTKSYNMIVLFCKSSHVRVSVHQNPKD